MAARVLNLILWTFVASFLLALAAVIGLSLVTYGAGAAVENDMRSIMQKIDAQDSDRRAR